MPISYQNQGVKFQLKDKKKVSDWIKKIIVQEKRVAGQINFVFMDDAGILENNIRFLNHDTYTDIITFDYCENNTVNGDIMISVERVVENAKKFDVAFEKEILRVIIHGVLHLCGYKDKKKSDVTLMRKKEDAALKKF